MMDSNKSGTMISWPLIMAGLAIALAIYYYLIGGLKFFEKTGIPYLKPKLLVGNMSALVLKRRSMAEQVKWIYDSHPDAKYVGFHDFMLPTIILRDPEIIKYVTVKNFDNFVNHSTFIDENLDPFFGKNLFGLQNDRWREMRSILSPAFTSSKMKGMFDLVSKCAEKFAENLATRTQFKEVELKDYFTRYTMDVIASAAFGITVDSVKEPNNEFYVMGHEATTFDYVRTLKLFLFKVAPTMMSLFRIRVITDRVSKFFTHIVSSTVKSREAEGKSRNDMIQLMMHARDSGKVANLSMEDMTAQAFIFFFGGFDTTATAMSFAAYEIAINPHIQEKLREEVDSVLDGCDGNVTWEAFQGLHYLEAVIYEALRKYPPATVTDRVCNKAIEIPPAVEGGKPYLVKPGVIFWLPYYGLHHDPQYFKEPDVFDPERFIDPLTGKTKEPPGFLPFGIGPRFCIGQRFALMEVKLAMFHIIAKCQLKPCARTQIPIVLARNSINMGSQHGFWVEVVPRK